MDRTQLMNGNTPVTTQTEGETKPGWWKSLLAQLTGNPIDRTIKNDEVEHADTDQTEGSPANTTATDELLIIEEPQLIDEIIAQNDSLSTSTDEAEVIDEELVPEIEEITPDEPNYAATVTGGEELITNTPIVMTEPAIEEPVAVVETATPELESTESATVDIDTPEVAPETPELAAVEIEPEIEPCNYTRVPSGPVKDRDDLTERWVNELRSGNHQQTHGCWESAGTFFNPQTKECTLQVAINTFDIPLGQLRDKYGDLFIGDVLHKNDVQLQSYKEIADYIEETQLSRRSRREMEMER